jgi:hypothetical protein
MSIGLMQERPPFIRFTTDTVEDRNASLQAGRYIAKDVDIVNITPAGSKDVVVRDAKEWLTDIKDRARKNPPEYNPAWAQHFEASYATWKEGNEIPTYGTPIRTWPVVSPAQVTNLVGLKVMTVEDLAVANEETLRHLGMGARDLKAKAIAWLASAKDTGVSVQRVADLETKVEALLSQSEQKDDLIAELTAKLAAQSAPKGRRQATSLAERAQQMRDDRDVV